MKGKIAELIVPFALFMFAIGGGFLAGSIHQRGVDLEHCKKAGWEFVEEVIISREFAQNHPRGKEYGMSLLLNLHANIATKCIVRIDK